MTWIATVAPDAAEGRLEAVYDRIRSAAGDVDNVMRAHSLRPHLLEGHMALYKAVLHHTANTVPAWFLETLGVHVSLINGCGYCVDHHFAGLRRLLGDDARADAVRRALETGDFDAAFEPRERRALDYAGALTTDPAAVDEAAVAALRAAGWDDGEILEINQVVAYFAYANRTVLGLGVTADGEVLGLAPPTSGDLDDWSHG